MRILCLNSTKTRTKVFQSPTKYKEYPCPFTVCIHGTNRLIKVRSTRDDNNYINLGPLDSVIEYLLRQSINGNGNITKPSGSFLNDKCEVTPDDSGEIIITFLKE